MKFDPQLQPFIAGMAQFPKMDQVPLATMRDLVRQASTSFPKLDLPMGEITDRIIDGPGGDLRIRVYQPAAGLPAPVLVYFHGGGFVMGDLDTQDMIARGLCHAAACVVVSVDYRLAPEHPFPAPVDDCWAATLWAADHAAEIGGIPGKIAVAGDSAGGVLSAAVAMRARDEGGPRLSAQVLIYGGDGYPTGESETWKRYPHAPLADIKDVLYFWDTYLTKPEDRLNPLASPGRAADFSGLAPALIITAEYDCTSDDSEAYGRKLVAAGVPVLTRRYIGAIHGFVSWLGMVDCARSAIDDAGGWLKLCWAR